MLFIIKLFIFVHAGICLFHYITNVAAVVIKAGTDGKAYRIILFNLFSQLFNLFFKVNLSLSQYHNHKLVTTGAVNIVVRVSQRELLPNIRLPMAGRSLRIS